ncbi:hypothetical protein GCM10012278_75660 [Nonomuraea glycinis]|uniref:AMP-binding enzyme C-terminal domain-containing protein n=1 Tax=Nonomuraea glycinis TaxID=2047744 RepID=A0A918ACK5_9ACTN|nr:hypothetical protein GCM10012278_75660 [Nonomuraea glycinis]
MRDASGRRHVAFVHVVDSFPITVTGKIHKVEMRARALGLRAVAELRNA